MHINVDLRLEIALKELVLMPLMYPQLYSSLGTQPTRWVGCFGGGGWGAGRGGAV
jgi:hypothetical protein